MTIPSALAAACLLGAAAMAAEPILSHPPLRPAPEPSARPLRPGPARFCDPVRGDDAQAGTQEAPWRTIGAALGRLGPGETLVLRGGVYYEQVYCAAAGRPDAPIVIRSHPGELAVIDGGYREFFEAPASAWEPFGPDRGGAADEYRSARTYPNIRDVIGSFGDSMIGLSTYFHAADMRATNEVWRWADPAKQKETDCEPMYCGPGLWYDAGTGRIHVRLARTAVTGAPNYAGETDPRKLPLVIAPFRAVPLVLDRARHLALEDIAIRGAGYDCVVLDYAEGIRLDNVTVWAGTYGVRASGTGPLLATRCGFYGNVPPWLARSDTSKRAYPGRPFRDITRLNTHATWVIENGREFSVFATPVNDNWEIAYCDFADSHDGPYFGGVSLRFHHNLVANTQDDGLYLSQMYPRHLYGKGGAEIRIYQNLFSRCLTALAFGGTEDTADRILVYRNVFDLRAPVYTGRPSAQKPVPAFSSGKVIGDHGAPPWPEMAFYQNTFACGSGENYAMALLGALSRERPRRLFNNACVNFARLMIPAAPGGTNVDCTVGGNLYWSPGTDAPKGAQELARLQPGLPATNSLVADPRFVAASADPAAANDYRPADGSPAVNAGLDLPPEWEDPLRAADAGRPDIGALPLGAPAFTAGRAAAPAQAP